MLITNTEKSKVLWNEQRPCHQTLGPTFNLKKEEGVKENKNLRNALGKAQELPLNTINEEICDLKELYI